jgi:hypothetical protein
MSEPTLPREPEGLRSRTIWLVAAATVAVALALTAIAWLLVVVPNGSPAASQPSSLRHTLFDTARDGADARAAAMQTLERNDWVDRAGGIVHIPIDQAIDAVVANPALIGGSK